MPCKYGVRCNNPVCIYWHTKLPAIELCPDGKKCRARSCRKSHDKPLPFCSRTCDMATCKYTHPCKYGIRCININTCAYDHPLTENILAIGKCNLLYAASKCAANLDPKYFDISVSSHEDLCMNVMDWYYMQQMHVDFSKFDWAISPTSYVWAPNETFQDFANERLGGGTLGLGNVQEEIMMRSLGLLQYLYRGWQHDKMHILSSNLRDNPLLIDTYVVVKDTSAKEHYGNNGLIHAAKSKDVLFEAIQPFRVKIMCVAMERLITKDGSSYNIDVLQASLESLVKAYMISLIANELDIDVLVNSIHIGNIGCGVFNHNYNVIYVLQKTAAAIAINIVMPQKKVRIEYHTYDDQTMAGIKANAIPVLEYFLANNFDVSGILAKIIEYQKIKPEIWAQKI